jgi:hypothetical protein
MVEPSIGSILVYSRQYHPYMGPFLIFVTKMFPFDRIQY